MIANRDEPDASHRPEIYRNATFLVRPELTEALAELRRLIQDPFFDGLERVLADLGQAPTVSAEACCGGRAAII